MSTGSAREKADGAEESSMLVYYTARLLRHWKEILGAAVVAVAVALGLLLLKPETYTARIMLFQNRSEVTPAQALMGRLPASLLGGAGRSVDDGGRIVDLVLQSRALRDSLAQRAGVPRDAQIEARPDGTILVEVLDRDPARAARIANAYPGAINSLVADITLQTAARRQALLESQLTQARAKLEQVELRALEFERSQGAAQLKEQTEASVAAAVQLQKEIGEQEIHVSQLRRTATPDNPALRTAVAELEARRQQLQRLRSGSGGWSILPALQESPELKLAAARILRDLAEAEAIYASLSASLTSSHIDAHTRMPVVEVLDAAIVPTEPTPTKTGLLLLLAAALGLVLASGAVVVQDLVERARGKQEYAELFAAWSGVRQDLRRALPRRRGRRALRSQTEPR
jgi:tyrosine-protein kinase Etk/Wzc